MPCINVSPRKPQGSLGPSEVVSEQLAEQAQQIHAELAATGALPVERRASRLLGEAEAVAADAATSELEPAVTRKRLEQVLELLEAIEETNSERAEEHVERARSICHEVLSEE